MSIVDRLVDNLCICARYALDPRGETLGNSKGYVLVDKLCETPWRRDRAWGKGRVAGYRRAAPEPS